MNRDLCLPMPGMGEESRKGWEDDILPEVAQDRRSVPEQPLFVSRRSTAGSSGRHQDAAWTGKREKFAMILSLPVFGATRKGKLA